ncbi:hypothetical protein BH11MYX3_BH11MYX3_33390 [soil metagenome]
MVAPAAPAPVRCFRCGATGVWHPQANQWGCDHCRDLIGGPPQFPAPYPTATTPGAPPGVYATQPVPKCTRCWGDGTWQAAVGKWGCDRCKTYLDPAVIAAASSTSAAGDAGVKVAKFLLWMVLLIALIAIKVALRRHR